jgi:hypothetical protein
MVLDEWFERGILSRDPWRCICSGLARKGWRVAMATRVGQPCIPGASASLQGNTRGRCCLIDGWEMKCGEVRLKMVAERFDGDLIVSCSIAPSPSLSL